MPALQVVSTAVFELTVRRHRFKHEEASMAVQHTVVPLNRCSSPQSLPYWVEFASLTTTWIRVLFGGNASNMWRFLSTAIFRGKRTFIVCVLAQTRLSELPSRKKGARILKPCGYLMLCPGACEFFFFWNDCNTSCLANAWCPCIQWKSELPDAKVWKWSQ